MALLPALTADEATAAMLRGSSDVKFILADNNGEVDIQAVLFHLGFSTLGSCRVVATWPRS